MSAPLATLTAADLVGLLAAAAVCAFLLYALLRGENL
jgi:hypothetical protein